MVLKKRIGLFLILFTILSAQSVWSQENGRGQTPVELPRFSFHGYGEIHYHNPKGTSFPNSDAPAEIDVHRMVWGISYDISNAISLHTQFDYEQTEERLALEFLYLDFFIHPTINFRVGSLLMPVGPLNEFHEPPFYYSVSRPYVQRHIIPTTWQEGGIGIFGAPVPGFNYRAYVVSSLDARKFDSTSGIRSARGGVSEAESDDLAFVLRGEYTPLSGVDLGLSFYNGGADASKQVGGSPRVQILEWDARIRVEGLDFQWVYVLIDVDDVSAINAAHIGGDGLPLPLTGSDSVGEQMVGTSIEAAYHFSYLMGSEWDLVPFIRYETFNTQNEVPAGNTSNPANDLEVLNIGTAFYPHPQVALKIDRESWEDGRGGTGLRYNLGAAYMF